MEDQEKRWKKHLARIAGSLSNVKTKARNPKIYWHTPGGALPLLASCVCLSVSIPGERACARETGRAQTTQRAVSMYDPIETLSRSRSCWSSYFLRSDHSVQHGGPSTFFVSLQLQQQQQQDERRIGLTNQKTKLSLSCPHGTLWWFAFVWYGVAIGAGSVHHSLRASRRSSTTRKCKWWIAIRRKKQRIPFFPSVQVYLIKTTWLHSEFSHFGRNAQDEWLVSSDRLTMASHGLTNRSPSKFRHTTSDESVVKRQISHPIGRDVTQCLICETTHSCKHTRLVMVISEECRSNDKRKNKPTCQPTIETWQKRKTWTRKKCCWFSTTIHRRPQFLIRHSPVPSCEHSPGARHLRGEFRIRETWRKWSSSSWLAIAVWCSAPELAYNKLHNQPSLVEFFPPHAQKEGGKKKEFNNERSKRKKEQKHHKLPWETEKTSWWELFSSWSHNHQVSSFFPRVANDDGSGEPRLENEHVTNSNYQEKEGQKGKKRGNGGRELMKTKRAGPTRTGE